MRALTIVFLWLAGNAVVQAGEVELDRLVQDTAPAIEVAGTCTLEREATSGAEKFCYYDCVGSKKTITINANEFCPLDMD